MLFQHDMLDGQLAGLEFRRARYRSSELMQQTPVKLKIQEELDAGRGLAGASAGAVIIAKEIGRASCRESEEGEAVTAGVKDREDDVAEPGGVRERQRSL